MSSIRLTSFAAGGGCACKIPARDLHTLVGALGGQDSPPDLLVGIDQPDDAAVVRIGADSAVISTADFFTPVVDDPFDWGRIAATNALSDVYAMGGRPLMAINLLAWPTATLDFDIAAEVLRGGVAVAAAAGIPVAGGHSITAPEPLYGMAVTGVARPADLITVANGAPGLPLTLTKSLGTGVLFARHKATGESCAAAVDSATTLNKDASEAAVAAGIRAGTDVTGFGLLGHLLSLARASRVDAVIDAAAVPYLPGVREALAAGFAPGGSRRNLDWARPALATELPDSELLLLADAQTSGGLLLAGELPGHPVIGRLIPRAGADVRIRIE